MLGFCIKSRRLRYSLQMIQEVTLEAGQPRILISHNGDVAAKVNIKHFHKKSGDGNSDEGSSTGAGITIGSGSSSNSSSSNSSSIMLVGGGNNKFK